MEKSIRIRKLYAPLNISSSISANGNALSQIYDAYVSAGEYVPDYTVTPLVLTPIVKLDANDGSMEQPLNNENLANVIWYLDNVEINQAISSSSHPLVNGISIETNGIYKGQLTINKNITVGTSYRLRFEADIADTRINQNIHLVSDTLTLKCEAHAEDEWKIELSKTHMVERRLTYFYNGVTFIHFNILKGNTRYIYQDLSQIQIKLIEKESNIVLSEILRGAIYNYNKKANFIYFIESVTSSQPRNIIYCHPNFIKNSTFEIILIDLIKGVELDRKEFSVKLEEPPFTVIQKNINDINQDTKIIKTSLSIKSNGDKILNSPSIYKIWKTDTDNAKDVVQGYGDTANISVEKAQMDEDMDIKIIAGYKDIYKTLSFNDEALTFNGDFIVATCLKQI